MTNLIIHRGTNEIGGCAVELNEGKTRLLFDFGIPLEAMDCEDFNIEDYKSDIKGLYRECGSRSLTVSTRDSAASRSSVNDSDVGLQAQSAEAHRSKDEAAEFDAVFLTHAHPDHHGLLELVNPEIPIYVTKVTYDVLKKITPLLPNSHTADLNLKPIEDVIEIGGIKITARNVDHSIAGACAFEIQTGGKTLVYTGDIRFHGRASWQSSVLTKNVPNPDYHVLEGTTLGRVEQDVIKENDLIPQFTEIFKGDKLPLVQFSPQNLDRFITVYKACLKAKKTFVIDPYTCYVLEVYGQVSKNIPQFDWNNIMVYFAKNSITKQLGDTKKLYEYKSKKVSLEEIVANPEKYVVKGNYVINNKIFEAMPKEKLTIIHSMWKGYLDRPSYMDDYKDITVCIHTSGHAYIEDLQRFVEKINPKNIIPIHTEHKDKYAELYNANIIVLNDGEKLEL